MPQLNGGSLTVNGVPVVPGTTVVSKNRDPERSIRVHAGANANSAITNPSNKHRFTFQLRDGGTAVVLATSADTDPTPNTMTLAITPVNDRPTTATKAISIVEDQAGGYTFTSGDFAFNDPSDTIPPSSVQPHQLDAIMVNAPTSGTLEGRGHDGQRHDDRLAGSAAGQSARLYAGSQLQRQRELELPGARQRWHELRRSGHEPGRHVDRLHDQLGQRLLDWHE